MKTNSSGVSSETALRHNPARAIVLALLTVLFWSTVATAFKIGLKAMSFSSNNAKIANLIYLAPFLSLIPIHFILKEPVHYTTIVGLFFIISGILFQQIRFNRIIHEKKENQ